MLTPITKIALPSRFVVFHFQFLYKFQYSIFPLLRFVCHYSMYNV